MRLDRVEVAVNSASAAALTAERYGLGCRESPAGCCAVVRRCVCARARRPWAIRLSVACERTLQAGLRMRCRSCSPLHMPVFVSTCRAAIERMRLENEALKAELHLEQRESKMLESDVAKERLTAIDRESTTLLKRVEELRRQEVVRIHDPLKGLWSVAHSSRFVSSSWNLPDSGQQVSTRTEPNDRAGFGQGLARGFD